MCLSFLDFFLSRQLLSVNHKHSIEFFYPEQKREGEREGGGGREMENNNTDKLPTIDFILVSPERSLDCSFVSSVNQFHFIYTHLRWKSQSLVI